MDEAGSLADLDDDDLLDEEQEGLELDSDGDGEDRGDDDKSSMDFEE